jgi:hypothetical protein
LHARLRLPLLLARPRGCDHIHVGPTAHTNAAVRLEDFVTDVLRRTTSEIFYFIFELYY